MLLHLAIRNVALIESCDIHFSQGLCVLSGETGAGKSILLDALGLVLGNRADSKLVRHGESQATVTAEFDILGNSAITQQLETLGFEVYDSLVLRRALGANGKGRCFINDQPASLSTLRTLGDALVEVHGQHQQRDLMQVSNHRDVLDAYGNLEQEQHYVSEAYDRWKHAEKQLQELEASIQAAREKQELLEHTAKELSDLMPQAGEEEELAEIRTRMLQAEKHAQKLHDAMAMIEEETGVEMQIASLQKYLLRGQAEDGPALEPVIEYLEQAMVQLQNAQNQLHALSDQYYYDEATLETTEERLFALKAAARKYQVGCDELPDLLTQTEQALMALSGSENDCAALKTEIREAKEQYEMQADALSVARKHAGQRLEKALLQELAPLKMQKTQFRVQMGVLEETQWSRYGKDAITFVASTNPGNPLQPIHEIASGGELSRFMLALKVVLSGVRSRGTMVFDEIDTGTGGAVADAIGARLAQLGEMSQVLVVTHLPQVAARGSQHFHISKKDSRGKTFTYVKELATDERREEIARMLAAKDVTDEARAAAEKLLASADE